MVYAKNGKIFLNITVKKFDQLSGCFYDSVDSVTITVQEAHSLIRELPGVLNKALQFQTEEREEKIKSLKQELRSLGEDVV